MHHPSTPAEPRRPPLRHLLAYRMFSARLPYEYRSWARADVPTPWFPLKQVLGSTVFAIAIQAGAFAGAVLTARAGTGEWVSINPPAWLFIGYPAAIILSLALSVALPRSRRRTRSRMLAKHDFHADGTPVIRPHLPTPHPPPAAPDRRYRN